MHTNMLMEIFQRFYCITIVSHFGWLIDWWAWCASIYKCIKTLLGSSNSSRNEKGFKIL